MINFALAGNPNSGKTTLFNALTGSTAHVGNWPGVTVDKREGTYKKCPKPINVIDLPGIYSLSPYTPEEVISRKYILDEKPDCVINIIDATNLERNLYLTSQIMEIDVPVVVALNMMDQVAKNGIKLDAKKLSDMLEVPCIEISALNGTGIDELMTVAYAESMKKRKGVTVLKESSLGHLIQDVTIALEGNGVENPVFHAVKLAELDELEVKMHPSLVKMVDDFKKTFKDNTFGDDFEAVVADGRYNYITSNLPYFLTRPANYMTAQTKSDKIDKVLTNKWLGIPCFLLILFAIFHITFSENFLFLGGIISDDWVSLEGSFLEGMFGAGAINSPGVILFNLVDGCLGALTEVIAGALEGAMAEWAVGLICDGILGGLFAIIGFLPQILVLFLLFSILEDSGYMARVAFILDRPLRKFGLSGRAFMPMIMGFGCSVPAMINTRTLADEKERTATVRVIPFFSCGAKLPILTAVAGAMVTAFGLASADFITYGMYVIGIIVALVSAIIMRNTTMRGEIPPFIMELPTYLMPKFTNLMLHLWDKAKHFVKKAFTVILASTIVIWVVTHFSFDWTFLSDEQINLSILANIGMLIQPIFTPLGFGSQLGAYGWMFAVAAITGLIAKENVIATFATLAACIVAGFEADEEGITAVVEMINATQATQGALLAFIVFNMTTIPCFAAVGTAKGELSSKDFKWTLVFWLVASYLAGAAVYTIVEWPWTAAIWTVALAVVIAAVVLINKKSIKKAVSIKKQTV